MKDLLFIALFSALAVFLSLPLIIAFLGGFLIAVLFGSVFSFLAIIPALLISLGTAFFLSLKFELTILSALIESLAILAGYLIGSLLNLVFFPIKFILNFFKGIFKLLR